MSYCLIWFTWPYHDHLCHFLFQYFRYIEIAIKQCRSSGIDCKVHGLTVVGRLRADEDDTAASYSFLASDREDEDEEKTATITGKKKGKGGGCKEIQTHVFCWGLNDKDQLGGPKGSKVKTDLWINLKYYLQGKISTHF